MTIPCGTKAAAIVRVVLRVEPTTAGTRRQRRAGWSWWRRLAAVDRDRSGAEAFVPEGRPFLPAGENDLPVGAVLLEGDTADHTARVWLVTAAGLFVLHMGVASLPVELRKKGGALWDKVVRATMAREGLEVGWLEMVAATLGEQTPALPPVRVEAWRVD